MVSLKQATNCGITTCTDGRIIVVVGQVLSAGVGHRMSYNFALPYARQFLAVKQTVRQQPNAYDIRKDEHESFDSLGEIHLDGSIQGFSALLNPPGYFKDQITGNWWFQNNSIDAAAISCTRHQHSRHGNNATQNLAIDAIDR